MTILCVHCLNGQFNYPHLLHRKTQMIVDEPNKHWIILDSKRKIKSKRTRLTCGKFSYIMFGTERPNEKYISRVKIRFLPEPYDINPLRYCIRTSFIYHFLLTAMYVTWNEIHLQLIWRDWITEGLRKSNFVWVHIYWDRIHTWS